MPGTFTSSGELFKILERERQAQGISQRSLSIRAGLSHGAYWYSSARGVDITIDTAARYADVLGLKLQVQKEERP